VEQEAWDTEHPVLSLLRRRRDEGSLPGQRNDDAKLGLAVEGGGMRGVVSASMLTVIDDLGFANCFDDIYACSSGAINAAYYLAGGTWYPLTIYFDELSTPNFVNLRNVFNKKPILNLTYAFSILADVKPLDYRYILNSPIPLHIAITLVDELKTIVADTFTSEADMEEALQASTWLPVAVDGTTSYRGKRAVDGGVLTALPFRLALQDSCTHVMSLSTHPMGVIHEDLSLLNRYTKRHLNKLQPALGDGYIEALNQKYHDQHMLAGMRVSSNYGEPFIFDIAPLSGTPDVKRHELQVSKLLEAARSAYEVMYAVLAGRPSSAVQNHLIRAMPRFSIAERSQDDRRLIKLFDPSSGAYTPWGIARDR
jgi:predicted patatin/cPLA2 family phospholipase